MNNKISITI